MTKDIYEFYESITYKAKNIVEYKSKEGDIKLIPIINCLVQCEYIEIEEEKLAVAKFQKIVDDLELDHKDGVVQRDKFQRTKNKKDMGVIEDINTKIYYCWIVSNQIGIKKTFIDVQEAQNYTDEINNKIIEMMEEK